MDCDPTFTEHRNLELLSAHSDLYTRYAYDVYEMPADHLPVEQDLTRLLVSTNDVMELTPMLARQMGLDMIDASRLPDMTVVLFFSRATKKVGLRMIAKGNVFSVEFDEYHGRVRVQANNPLDSVDNPGATIEVSPSSDQTAHMIDEMDTWYRVHQHNRDRT